MKKTILFAAILGANLGLYAQTNPAITSWLQNTTNITGSHYVNGNSTPIADSDLANVQTVHYNNNFAFVSATGIPAYVTGPFLDGNPSLATAQNKIFKMPLNPSENTGMATETNAGNIGIFINGVALFDYRDGVSYSLANGTDQGGPGGGNPDGVWNRDAIPAEMDGFDCSKGHPAMGNYHHHQNPSAFNLDLNVVSTICNTYDADGLYAIDAAQHSPLLGFSYDGFPIYGAYGYANADGTGGITRIKSSYFLRNISVRTHYADGSNVTDGPAVNNSYPLGHYREDYEYIAGATEDFLDEHNGRFCVTPEYPAGIYCYFATVDANWNSAYPYAVGPTFYGNVTGTTVNSVPGAATQYNSTVDVSTNKLKTVDINVFPNPANEFIVVQFNALTKESIAVELYDISGKLLQETMIYQGSTIAHLDTKDLAKGQYLVKFTTPSESITKKVIIAN